MPGVISEPLDKFIQSTRFCGLVLLLVCAIAVMVSLGAEEPNMKDENRKLLIAAMVIGQGVPGIICFLLAWWMSKGRFWAFLTSIAFTILFIAKCGVGALMIDPLPKLALSAPCCTPLFLIYVATRAYIAWPEIMHLRRVEAHERQASALPVSAKDPPVIVPPPPPMRLPPRHKR
jgi:hypothetical protein